jgi:hypothetical protein
MGKGRINWGFGALFWHGQGIGSFPPMFHLETENAEILIH